MNDKAIIASLLSENSKLQSELEEWKAKYFIVEKAYAQLTNTGREDRDYFSEALASGAETAFCGKENYKST